MNIKDTRQILIGSIVGALVVALAVVAGCNMLDRCNHTEHTHKFASKSVKVLQQEQGEICDQQKKILDKLKHIEQRVNHGKR